MPQGNTRSAINQYKRWDQSAIQEKAAGLYSTPFPVKLV